MHGGWAAGARPVPRLRSPGTDKAEWAGVVTPSIVTLTVRTSGNHLTASPPPASPPPPGVDRECDAMPGWVMITVMTAPAPSTALRPAVGGPA